MLLNDLSARVHKANAKWWTDINTGEPIERDPLELICLMHSELGEMTEGVRKGLKDDHLPQYPAEQVELVDMLIRLFDYCAGFGVDFRYRDWDQYCDIRHAFPIPEESKLATIFRLHEALSKEGNNPDRVNYGREDNIVCYIINIIQLSISYARVHGFLDKLMEIFEAKMEYNANRADHKIENRRKAGGKKI